MVNYATTLSQGVYQRRSPRIFLRQIALSTLSKFFERDNASFLRCLFCHYVFDDQILEFIEIIDRLKRVGQFVNTSACLDMIEGRQPITGRYFHLSFDDGFKNILTNAMPVLKREKVPALFFVPTSFVGASDELVADYCIRIAKYRNPIEMCSWDDLKRVQDAGFEIGSHTRTHARFSDISGNMDWLNEELSGSKSDIERELGVSCQTISWPFGQLKDADAISLKATADFGYRACFGAFRGTVGDGGCDAYMIPRHHFEAQWPLSHVQYFLRGNKETRPSRTC